MNPAAPVSLCFRISEGKLPNPAQESFLTPNLEPWAWREALEGLCPTLVQIPVSSEVF